MSIIQPVLTYSPEGVLTISRGEPLANPDLSSESRLEQARDRVIDHLTEHFSGVKVDGAEDFERIHIPVAENLGENEAIAESRIGSLLLSASTLLPHDHDTAIDEVIRPSYVNEHLLRVIVFPQFQRFLNQGLSEDVTRDCLLAMATPLGEGKQERVREKFDYYKVDDTVMASGSTLEIITTPEVMEIEHPVRDGGTTMIQARGRWQLARLGGFGDAGMSVHFQERKLNKFDRDRKGLYNMISHNIDMGPQAFSLLLGLGSLAHHAAQYEGEEDIFADFS
jgi:hypothetical protein